MNRRKEARRIGGAGWWGLVAGAILLSVGAPVWAGEGADAAAAANPRGDWDFDLAFYSWIADVTGNATVDDVTVDVEPQLWNDIIKNLNIALFGGAEVRYRSRWIFNFDLNLIRLSTEEDKGPYPIGFGPETFTTTLKPVEGRIQVDTPLGPLEVPVQLRPGDLRVDVPRVQTALGPFEIDTKLTQVMTRAALGYRALDEPLLALFGGESQDDPRSLRVDLLAGIRYYRMRTEVEIKSPPIRVPPFQVTSSVSGGRVTVGGELLPPQTIALPRVDLPGLQFSGATFGGTDIDADETDWWIDPIVGARLGADVSEKLSLVLAGNVGGFGIGSASKFSWETLFFARYRLGEHWGLAAGYRALGYEHDSGDLVLDLIQHGPVLGATYSF